tara:strand:- start:26 stop:136 length:111 start_codon:yes stop_codon:yes gene_type:complete
VVVELVEQVQEQLILVQVEVLVIQVLLLTVVQAALV